MPTRSSVRRIFDVACRWIASIASARSMPQPSSLTRIDVRPPSATSMATTVAPASSAFSISSLTADAGRSTTSPAAIWSATSLGRTAIPGTGETYSPWAGASPAGDRHQPRALDPALAIAIEPQSRPYPLPSDRRSDLAGIETLRALGVQRRCREERRATLGHEQVAGLRGLVHSHGQPRSTDRERDQHAGGGRSDRATPASAPGGDRTGEKPAGEGDVRRERCRDTRQPGDRSVLRGANERQAFAD